jgi:hypothetical protein
MRLRTAVRAPSADVAARRGRPRPGPFFPAPIKIGIYLGVRQQAR